MTVREWWHRSVAWTRRRQLERELTREMQTHAELLARDFEHDGMSRAAARAAARRQLGNTAVLREASRDYWGFPAVDAVLHDLRYAVRGLARSPGFTLTVVVTLGLGIGANAAMFAVIDRLMFRPFPLMHAPSTVHRVYIQSTYRGKTNTRAVMPYTRFLDFKRETRSFSAYAAISEWRLAVGTGADTRVRKVAGVSASFFDFFDARPALGRYFTDAEDTPPDGALVAVLSHDYWQSQFGGRQVVGEKLRVGLMTFEVIGVAPAGFVGLVQGRAPELFVPITTVPANINRSATETYFTRYTWDWMELIVRRRPGVSIEMASADLTGAYSRSRAAQRAITPTVLPDSIARPRAMASALRGAAGPDAGPEARVLLWVAGVAGIVLLIACANVANLMFARVLRRRREIAVRLALGVSRGRLVAQFITEGALLALLGCLFGLVVAQWGGLVARPLLLPEGSTFHLMSDWRTIGAASVCALAVALLTAIGPAMLASRSELANTLKAGVREGSYQRSRVRSLLLLSQGALTMLLLVGAALFVQSLEHVRAIPLGYDVSRVIEVHPDFRGVQFDSVGAVEARHRLLQAARDIPGVQAAALVNSTLFSTNTADLRVPGIDSVARLGRFNLQVSTPDYFAVMQTHIVRGRGFTSFDRASSAPVVVVSQAMARTLWPGRTAIGECIQVKWPWTSRESGMRCFTVVGIAEDAAFQKVTDNERLVYYLLADQVDPGIAATILVRLAGVDPARNVGRNVERDMEREMERVRRRLQAVMPGDGLVLVRALSDLVNDEQRSWQLGATMFVAFGVLALVVAAVGLYGVIGYNVAQRMHELGVRIALGARASDIVRLVVGQGFVFAATGVSVGIVLALLAARWLEPLLFRQSARDPFIYVTVALVVVAVAVLASAVPAYRATRADPNRALRVD